MCRDEAKGFLFTSLMERNKVVQFGIYIELSRPVVAHHAAGVTDQS